MKLPLLHAKGFPSHMFITQHQNPIAEKPANILVPICRGLHP